MNAHALSVLEFPRVLEVVAGFAASDLGAARVRSLTPTTDTAVLDREHARVAAVRETLGGDDPWRPDPVPDLSGPLTRLRVIGSLWTGPELMSAATLLRSSRRTQQRLRDPKRPAIVRAMLAPLLDVLISAQTLEDRIAKVIADDGTVKDDASAALRRIRRELRSAHGELVRILEREMSKLEPHHRVADSSVTMRNGRYVIPVRREARVVAGGIVHDTSASGATLFVEPPAAVEFGNRMRELESEEFEEVEKILRELTDDTTTIGSDDAALRAPRALRQQQLPVGACCHLPWRVAVDFHIHCHAEWWHISGCEPFASKICPQLVDVDFQIEIRRPIVSSCESTDTLQRAFMRASCTHVEGNLPVIDMQSAIEVFDGSIAEH